MTRFALWILTIILLASIATAQVVSYGVIPYPRSSALGSSYTGIADDAGAVFFNPAGLTLVNGIEASLSYQRPYGLSFFDEFAGAVVLPMNQYGVAALSMQNFSVSYQGYDLSAERSVALSYAATVLKDIHTSLAFGLTGKWLYWKLGDSVPGASGSTESLGQASTFGLDIGAQASLWRRTKVGASIVNVNNPRLGDPTPHDLPQIFRAGISYKPYSSVATVIGAERILGQDVEFGAGVEAWIFPELALRVGINSNPNRFTAGFGLRIRQIGLDYAFLTHPQLPSTHQVSIGFALPKSFLDLIYKNTSGGSL